MDKFAYLGFDRDEFRLLSLMIQRELGGSSLCGCSRDSIKAVSVRVDDAFKVGVSS